MKKLLTNIWFWIGVAFSVLLLILGSEKARRKLAELKLFGAILEGKDAVLEEKRSQVKDDLETEKVNEANLNEELKSVKKEATEQEKIDFWNKR